MIMTEDGIRKSLREYKVPAHDHDGIVLYLLHGIPPGSFLTAVIQNKLSESFARADSINRRSMFNIVNWLYNCAPVGCWKSVDNMNQWIQDVQAGKSSWNQ